MEDEKLRISFYDKILKIFNISRSHTHDNIAEISRNQMCTSHQMITKSNSNRILIIQKHILLQTYDLFSKYCDQRVESVVYWYGKESVTNNTDVILSVVIPHTLRKARNYEVLEKSVTNMSNTMHVKSLVCLAQFHTHPGHNTEHSFYDDTNALSSRNGFLSLVTPNYGCNKEINFDNISIHEAWKQKWYFLSDSAKKTRIFIIDDLVDLRTND